MRPDTDKLHLGSAVKLPDGRFGRVDDFIGSKKVAVNICDDHGMMSQKGVFARDQLRVIPPKVISVQELRSFARFELGPDDIFEDDGTTDGWRLPDETCVLGLDDAEACVRNLKAANVTAEDFFAWLSGMSWELYDAYVFRGCEDGEWTYRDLNVPPATESDFMWALYLCFNKTAYYYFEDHLGGDDTGFMDFDLMLEDIGRFRAGDAGSVKPYLWSIATKGEFISNIRESEIAKMDEDQKSEYREVLEDLCEQDDLDALKTRAYATYGDDNQAYPNDWEDSRDRLLALMDNPDVSDKDKGIYANSLGYINYYGYCGQVNYEAAYKYFSLGLHAAGLYESAYKLADMYLDGKGVAKSELAAYHLVSWCYENCLKDFCIGGFQEVGCKFADAALRLARFYRDGVVVDKNEGMAYALLTQASYAMECRARAGGYMGDENVSARIEKELDQIREKVGDAEAARWTSEDRPYEISQTFGNGHEVYLTLERKKKFVKITAEVETKGIVYERGDKMFPPECPPEPLPQALITSPRYHFCELRPEVLERAYGDVKVRLFDKSLQKEYKKRGAVSFHADDMHANVYNLNFRRSTAKANGGDASNVGKASGGKSSGAKEEKAGTSCVVQFMNGSKIVAELEAREFRFEVNWYGNPKEQGEQYKAHTFAKVTFAPGDREYDFLCDDVDIHEGDHAIVETQHGEAEVEVVGLFRSTMDKMPLAPESYKEIVRRV